MKKKMVTALLAVSMLAGLSAVNVMAADDDTITVGFSQVGAESDWRTANTESMKSTFSEENGYELIFDDAQQKQENQLTAIRNFIQQEVDYIVLAPVTETGWDTVLQEAKDAGIPIVACDDALQDDAGEKLAPWVGINAYVIGQTNGEWMANYAKDNDLVGKDDVGLLIMTMDTVSSCVPRAEGEYDKFKEDCADFNEDNIFYADYDGTTDKGNTAAAAVFTANPQITTWMVMGANEEGTIGACRALETAGLDANACVVGLGAYMAKDEWNDKGADGTCMKAAAYFSSQSVGEGSVDVLMKLINGEDVDMETAVDAEIVTPKTLWVTLQTRI